jgi:cyclic beta-1,2-glucan synthetase
VDRLQDMAERNPSHLVVVVADMARSELPLSSSFVAEFCQRLARRSPVLHLARTWLEQRLVEQGLSIEQLVQLESQQQAADQVSVSHSIASLRFLSAMDWKEFVESLSGSSRRCARIRPTSTARWILRHAIAIAMRSSPGPAQPLAEAEVARRAIQLAADSARDKGSADRTAHVGYYLIDKGRPVLERGRGAVALAHDDRTGHPPVSADVLCGRDWGAHAPRHDRVRPAGSRRIGAGMELAFFTLVFLLCASQLAVALMNWLSTLLMKPRPLPRLDYSSGIAPDCRTMVVVPRCSRVWPASIG